MGRPTPETGGGAPHNQGLSEFKPLAKDKGVGWGVKKLESQSSVGPERPIFQTPRISEVERAADERWEKITKKMERYTEEQENKIHLEWFDRSTAWLKSHGFTSKEDITPEKFTREQQLAYAIETAAMFEEIMERIDSSLDEAQGTQRPDTPPEQDTTGDSSSTSSK